MASPGRRRGEEDGPEPAASFSDHFAAHAALRKGRGSGGSGGSRRGTRSAAKYEVRVPLGLGAANEYSSDSQDGQDDEDDVKAPPPGMPPMPPHAVFVPSIGGRTQLPKPLNPAAVRVAGHSASPDAMPSPNSRLASFLKARTRSDKVDVSAVFTDAADIDENAADARTSSPEPATMAAPPRRVANAFGLTVEAGKDDEDEEEAPPPSRKSRSSKIAVAASTPPGSQGSGSGRIMFVSPPSANRKRPGTADPAEPVSRPLTPSDASAWPSARRGPARHIKTAPAAARPSAASAAAAVHGTEQPENEYENEHEPVSVAVTAGGGQDWPTAKRMSASSPTSTPVAATQSEEWPAARRMQLKPIATAQPDEEQAAGGNSPTSTPIATAQSEEWPTAKRMAPKPRSPARSEVDPAAEAGPGTAEDEGADAAEDADAPSTTIASPVSPGSDWPSATRMAPRPAATGAGPVPPLRMSSLAQGADGSTEDPALPAATTQQQQAQPGQEQAEAEQSRENLKTKTKKQKKTKKTKKKKKKIVVLSEAEAGARWESTRPTAASAELSNTMELSQEEYDVMNFALYLGMDPASDGDLLWIAEEAMYAPLPEGWEVGRTGSTHEFPNRQYYWNGNTSQWEHPLDQFYRTMFKQLKAKSRGEAERMLQIEALSDDEDQAASLHSPVKGEHAGSDSDELSSESEAEEAAAAVAVAIEGSSTARVHGPIGGGGKQPDFAGVPAPVVPATASAPAAAEEHSLAGDAAAVAGTTTKWVWAAANRIVTAVAALVAPADMDVGTEESQDADRRREPVVAPGSQGSQNQEGKNKSKSKSKKKKKRQKEKRKQQRPDDVDDETGGVEERKEQSVVPVQEWESHRDVLQQRSKQRGSWLDAVAVQPRAAGRCLSLSDASKGAPILPKPLTSKEQVEMARRLCIEAASFPELQWLVRLAIVAFVQEPWSIILDDGELFFTHEETGSTVREHPLDAALAFLAEEQSERSRAYNAAKWKQQAEAGAARKPPVVAVVEPCSADADQDAADAAAADGATEAEDVDGEAAEGDAKAEGLDDAEQPNAGVELSADAVDDTEHVDTKTAGDAASAASSTSSLSGVSSLSHASDTAAAGEEDEYAPAEEQDEYAPAEEEDEYAPIEGIGRCVSDDEPDAPVPPATAAEERIDGPAGGAGAGAGAGVGSSAAPAKKPATTSSPTRTAVAHKTVEAPAPQAAMCYDLGEQAATSFIRLWRHAGSDLAMDYWDADDDEDEEQRLLVDRIGLELLSESDLEAVHSLLEQATMHQSNQMVQLLQTRGELGQAIVDCRKQSAAIIQEAIRKHR